MRQANLYLRRKREEVTKKVWLALHEYYTGGRFRLRSAEQVVAEKARTTAAARDLLLALFPIPTEKDPSKELCDLVVPYISVFLDRFVTFPCTFACLLRVSSVLFVLTICDWFGMTFP